MALAGVVLWIECQPTKQGVAGSIPSHGISTLVGNGWRGEGIKKYKWVIQNSPGNVKYSIGNIVK